MMSNDNLINWEERYTLGIPVIDEEHKRLVELCNNLYKSILSVQKNSSEERKEAVKNALRECADYTQTHFKNEEKLMQLCKFSGFDAHKKEHNEFIKKILEKIQDFDHENFVSSLQFVKFLYDWILYHIAYTDTLYVKTLKESLKIN